MIHTLMEQTKRAMPVLKTCLDQYKDFLLDDYIDTITHETGNGKEIQSSLDMEEAVTHYLSSILDKKTAREVGAQLAKQKLLLSANHHETEFCVQALQGNILYERLLVKQGLSNGIIPIFSNTTVNMSNSNYPRGMLIYQTESMNNLIKIPIFPFKCRNILIAA